jgi:hypothetical protein
MAENSLGAYFSAPADWAALTAASAAFFSASGGDAQANAKMLIATTSGTTLRTRTALIGQAPPLGFGVGTTVNIGVRLESILRLGARVTRRDGGRARNSARP